MRVDMTPQNFRAADVLKIRQCYPKNQNNTAFYRTVTEFLREYNIPAKINNGSKNDVIELTYVTEAAKKRLNELGIEYKKS